LRVNIEIQQPINPNPDIQQPNNKTPRFVTPEPKAKTKLFDIIQKLIKLAIGGERNLKALLNYQIIKSSVKVVLEKFI
jgi:hypothetical protein